MSKRVSHSLLDPIITPPVKRLYPRLHIPQKFPPEGIILVGHLLAVTGAVGFALSTKYAWAGLLIALGVAGNHIADMLDGTHARTTRQCRNGGELLDHFTDPLSFAYWLIGLSISCGRLDLGLAAVVSLYATAVLTNIKAKMIGEFTLATFGPTEFKALLVMYGMVMSIMSLLAAGFTSTIAFGFLLLLVVVGIGQLVVQLILAVREVNSLSLAADQSEWVTIRQSTTSNSVTNTMARNHQQTAV